MNSKFTHFYGFFNVIGIDWCCGLATERLQDTSRMEPKKTQTPKNTFYNLCSLEVQCSKSKARADGNSRREIHVHVGLVGTQDFHSLLHLILQSCTLFWTYVHR